MQSYRVTTRERCLVEFNYSVEADCFADAVKKVEECYDSPGRPLVIPTSHELCKEDDREITEIVSVTEE